MSRVAMLLSAFSSSAFSEIALCRNADTSAKRNRLRSPAAVLIQLMRKREAVSLNAIRFFLLHEADSPCFGTRLSFLDPKRPYFPGVARSTESRVGNTSRLRSVEV